MNILVRTTHESFSLLFSKSSQLYNKFGPSPFDFSSPHTYMTNLVPSNITLF